MSKHISAESLSDEGKLLKMIEERLGQLEIIGRFNLLGPERITQFIYTDNLIRMYLPFGDVDSIQRWIIFQKNFFELKLLQAVAKHIPVGSVVVDAGANIGNHTIFFSKVLGASRVIAFEVMRETFKILTRNIELNELAGVEAHNVGLGAKAGRADLHYAVMRNMGGSAIRGSAEGRYPIQALDSFGLERVDFFKIDVEGAQLDVLEGARETLKRCRPKVWMELRGPLGEIEPGQAKMAELGYKEIEKIGATDFLFAPV